jgi:Uncharacterised protein family (UPF0203)
VLVAFNELGGAFFFARNQGSPKEAFGYATISTMGSSQSSSASLPPLPDPAPAEPPSVFVNSNNNQKQIDNGADASTRPTKSRSKSSQDDDKEKSLSGMDLVNYKCRRKHKAYKTCLSNWYKGEFLEAKSLDQDEVCGESFERYRKCVLKGIRKEIFDKQGKQRNRTKSRLVETVLSAFMPLNTRFCNHLLVPTGLRPPLPDSPLGELEEEEKEAAQGLPKKP